MTFNQPSTQVPHSYAKRMSGIAAAIALCSTPIFAQQADPLLTAMKTELERNKAQLVLPGMQRPYFIEYRLEDVAEYQADASFGALTAEQQTHQRVARVQVRIGDYKSDSSTSRGEGVVQLTSTDDDPDAIRHALWFATDEAYKSALNVYSQKQAALKRFQTPPTADDFSPAPATVKTDPLVKLEIDKDLWKKTITEASGLYASDAQVKDFAPDIQYSNASVRGLAVNRYIVNTDGTALRRGYTTYSAAISVGTQAPDGMRLSRDNGPVAATAKELESPAAFKKRVIDDLITLRDLRKAPVVTDDYHGPVLFSGDAATDIMNRLFVPNVEADKPNPGTTARTQGAFSSSYHQRVLADFFDVKDDPSLKTFNGQPVIGGYDVDDEGVPAQPVQVVSKGILQNYLINREPVKDFPTSNGHGRAQIARASGSRSSVIVFTPRTPTPAADMEKKLMTMATDGGRDFVYRADTLGGELLPRVLYRLYPDGKRELVRGAAFDELDQRSLRSDIVAAGDDPWVQNTAGPVPQTTIVPSLLFGEITVKRAEAPQEKLPYYAPPK